jgi:hypothetical protein
VCAAGSGVSNGLFHRLRATWGNKARIIALDSNPKYIVTASVLADEFINVLFYNEKKF